MDLIQLADALGKTVQEGDLLLSESGRVYVVVPTENSFRRQTILRVRRAKEGGRSLSFESSHTYLQPQFTATVTEGDVSALTLRERRQLYVTLTAPSRAELMKKLRQRSIK